MALLELRVVTGKREIMVDITAEVQAALSDAVPDHDGMVDVFIPHTTAGVTINEGADPSVARDILAGLARLVPVNAGYEHAEGNSDAHIKASLMGSCVSAPVERGRLRLGTWQSIYFAEFDGPRGRTAWLVLRG